MGLKVIITGVTGMVGEGVMMECLTNPQVDEILAVSRKPINWEHPKLKNCVVSDFFDLEGVKSQLVGYDACFYCAGVSSVGMNEADYTKITYDTMMHFAGTLANQNPDMVVCHISGASTDSTGTSRAMWASVKGRAENDLMKLPFKGVYNFRPGFMKPTSGQKNLKRLYKIINILSPLIILLMPGQVLTLKQVGQAMINCVLKGYSKQILEIKDIKQAAAM